MHHLQRLLPAFALSIMLGSITNAHEDKKPKPDRGAKRLGSVLVFSGTGWYRHPETAAVNGWLARLADDAGMQIDVTENAKDISALLDRYDVLVLNNSNELTKLFDELRRQNCNLLSLKDSLDLSTPAGRLQANLLASVAAYETEIRAERVKAGQQAARSRGKRWGGSKEGVRKRKTVSKMNSVLTLHKQGVPKAEISRAVGVSIPTIYSILREDEE